MLSVGVSIRVEVVVEDVVEVVVEVLEAASNVVLDPRMLRIEILVLIIVQVEFVSSNPNAGSAIGFGQGHVPGMP